MTRRASRASAVAGAWAALAFAPSGPVHGATPAPEAVRSLLLAQRTAALGRERRDPWVLLAAADEDIGGLAVHSLLGDARRDAGRDAAGVSTLTLRVAAIAVPADAPPVQRSVGLIAAGRARIYAVRLEAGTRGEVGLIASAGEPLKLSVCPDTRGRGPCTDVAPDGYVGRLGAGSYTVVVRNRAAHASRFLMLTD